MVMRRVKSWDRGADHARRQRLFEISGNDKAAKCARGRSGAAGYRRVKRHQSPIKIRRRAKDLVAQAGIHRQTRCRLVVILDKCREIGIPLVLSEKPRTPSAEGNVACPAWTAILRGALSEQEIIERPNIQQTIGSKWRIDHYLVTFRLGAHAHIVIAASERDRVLQNEAVGHLPLRSTLLFANRK